MKLLSWLRLVFEMGSCIGKDDEEIKQPEQLSGNTKRGSVSNTSTINDQNIDIKDVGIKDVGIKDVGIKDIDIEKSLNDSIDENLTEVLELEKLIESLESMDNKEKDKILGLIHSLKTREQTEEDEMNLGNVDNVVSTSNIEKIVNELLADKNINVKYLPDFIEKKMYINIFKLALGILAKTAQTAKIELLGHEISLKFKQSD